MRLSTIAASLAVALAAPYTSNAHVIINQFEFSLPPEDVLPPLPRLGLAEIKNTCKFSICGESVVPGIEPRQFFLAPGENFTESYRVDGKPVSINFRPAPRLSLRCVGASPLLFSYTVELEDRTVSYDLDNLPSAVNPFPGALVIPSAHLPPKTCHISRVGRNGTCIESVNLTVNPCLLLKCVDEAVVEAAEDQNEWQ